MKKTSVGRMLSGIRNKLYYGKQFIFHHKDYVKARKIRLENREYKTSYGKENPDKTFYLLRKNPEKTGILSCYLSELAQISLIEDKGIIPIMDMQTKHYDLIHNEEDGPDINAWEHYFEPLNEYSVNDALKSKNVIVGYGFTVPEGKIFFNNDVITKETIAKWSELDSKYIRLKSNVKAEFDKEYEQLIKGKRVLGSMFRDCYVALANSRDKNDPAYLSHPGIQSHPIQPDIYEWSDFLEKKMVEWNCDYLYIVCETTCTLDYLKERFGDKLIFVERKRRIVDELLYGKYLESEKEFYNNYSNVASNIDYLKEVYLLSKCTSLMTCKNSGSIVAGLWNKGQYENYEIMQLGLY